MTRIITDTDHPRQPFVECTTEDCENTHILNVDPDNWRPSAVYDDLEAAGWSAAPARCREHRADLYDSLSEEDRRAVVEYVIETGRDLAAKDEWEQEDNYQATEGLHEIYHRHIAHDIQEG